MCAEPFISENFAVKKSFKLLNNKKERKMCNKNSFAKMLSISGVQLTGLAVILALCKFYFFGKRDFLSTF